MVPASCVEVVSASVESRKLFLDGSMCLAERLAMEWGSQVIFLEAAILPKCKLVVCDCNTVSGLAISHLQVTLHILNLI